MARLKRNIPANQLEEMREQQPLARLLIRAQRAFNNQTTAKLEALGYRAFGGVQGGLFAQIDPDGTRLTTLAERLGITKQSVSQIVSDLEKNGYVQRLEDPTDRRASLVRFTERGWKFCQAINAVRIEVETEYEALLGKDAIRNLRTLLERLGGAANA